MDETTKELIDRVMAVSDWETLTRRASTDIRADLLTLCVALKERAERVEELEQAIRSFTSEEGEDLAESLYSSMGQSAIDGDWSDALDKHRKEIEKLRALVPPHRIG